MANQKEIINFNKIIRDNNIQIHYSYEVLAENEEIEYANLATELYEQLLVLTELKQLTISFDNMKTDNMKKQFPKVVYDQMLKNFNDEIDNTYNKFCQSKAYTYFRMFPEKLQKLVNNINIDKISDKFLMMLKDNQFLQKKVSNAYNYTTVSYSKVDNVELFTLDELDDKKICNIYSHRDTNKLLSIFIKYYDAKNKRFNFPLTKYNIPNVSPLYGINKYEIIKRHYLTDTDPSLFNIANITYGKGKDDQLYTFANVQLQKFMGNQLYNYLLLKEIDYAISGSIVDYCLSNLEFSGQDSIISNKNDKYIEEYKNSDIDMIFKSRTELDRMKTHIEMYLKIQNYKYETILDEKYGKYRYAIKNITNDKNEKVMRDFDLFTTDISYMAVVCKFHFPFVRGYFKMNTIKQGFDGFICGSLLNYMNGISYEQNYRWCSGQYTKYQIAKKYKLRGKNINFGNSNKIFVERFINEIMAEKNMTKKEVCKFYNI